MMAALLTAMHGPLPSTVLTTVLLSAQGLDEIPAPPDEIPPKGDTLVFGNYADVAANNTNFRIQIAPWGREFQLSLYI